MRPSHHSSKQGGSCLLSLEEKNRAMAEIEIKEMLGFCAHVV